MGRAVFAQIAVMLIVLVAGAAGWGYRIFAGPHWAVPAEFLFFPLLGILLAWVIYLPVWFLMSLVVSIYTTTQRKPLLPNQNIPIVIVESAVAAAAAFALGATSYVQHGPPAL